MVTEKIMGIPVDSITKEDVIRDLPEYFQKKQKMTVVSINPQIVVESKKYPDIIQFISRSSHRIPDGIGIVLVSKLTGGNITDRVAGFELMTDFLSYANKNEKRVFFYGSKSDILKDTIKNVSTDFPDLIVAGGIDGYTRLSEEKICEIINRAKPDFLFVGLGFPRQEQWLDKNMDKLNAIVFQDVGGSFDVLSGHVKRAPKILIKFHLEWLYRSLSNPKRITRILQLPRFLFQSLFWKLKENIKERSYSNEK